MTYDETAWEVCIDYAAAKGIGLTPKESRAKLRESNFPKSRLFRIDQKQDALTALDSVARETGVPMEICEVVLIRF